MNFPIIAVALVFLLFLSANLLSPFDPNQIAAGKNFAPPSFSNLFGTDNLGRDLLSRFLFGGRITILIASGATFIALIIGTTWGVLAAMTGGWVDEFLMRTADSLMAIPVILFALFCLSALGSSILSLLIVSGVLLSPSTARMARSAVVNELPSPYILAARASGLKRRELVWNELMVNITPQILVQGSINAASAVMLEATLSFVGFGLQPPSASLGTLILQGYAQMWNSIWFVLFPVLGVLLIVLVLNNLGESLRQSFDYTKSSS